MYVWLLWLAVVLHRTEFQSAICFGEISQLYQCFWWHGGIKNNRETTSLIKCQSSVLCDLRIKCIHCIKSWSYGNVYCAPFEARSWRIRWHRAWAPPMGPKLRRIMFVFHSDHWCLPWPVFLRRLTCTCEKILYGICMFSTHTREFKKRNELWVNSWCATVTLYCSDVLRFSVWVKTMFKSKSGWCIW